MSGEEGPELVLPDVGGSDGGYYMCNITVVTEGRSYTLLSNSGKLTVRTVLNRCGSVFMF